MADREKVKEASLSDKGYHYHERQLKEPKRSTIALCNFVRKTLPSTNNSYNAIDVGCGGGGEYVSFVENSS